MRFILILVVFLVASPSCISQDKKEDYWKKANKEGRSQ